MLRNNVLVKMEMERPTDIALPTWVEEERKIASAVGEVVALGPDVETCKVGDRVWLKSFVGNILTSPDFGEDILNVISEDDVLAIK
jgi:co-chaperonin GroES (HSP10)